MLDYIELTSTNHFFDGQWLYIKISNKVYRYLIKSYKNLNRQKRAYILTYHDEFVEYNFAFYDEKVRNWYLMLLKISSIGVKTIDLIIKEFSLEEFYEIVEKFNYQKLMKIKGVGEVLSKTIIDQSHQEIFKLKLNKKDEAIIKSLTKLGYSRSLILSKWKLLEHDKNSENTIKNLLKILGKKDE